MSNSQIRFTHVRRQPKGSPIDYTIAYTFSKTGDEITAHYGVAQCAKADTFSRATGRKIAEARLQKVLEGKVPALRGGSFTVKDAEGLSVGRLCSERFLTDRNEYLQDLDELRANFWETGIWDD